MNKFIKIISVVFFALFSIQSIAQTDLLSKETSVLEKFLKGKTILSYPHPRDPVKFGDIFFDFNFKEGTLKAGNTMGIHEGIFLSSKDIFCVAVKDFSGTCFVIKGEDLFYVNDSRNKIKLTSN